MSIGRPAPSEYAPRHEAYISKAPEGDILEILQRQGEEIRARFAAIPAEQEDYRYAEGKWSFRQMLGHFIDAERCFEHRAFRFSRGDASPLPSFEEDLYVAQGGYEARSLADLLQEFAHLRAVSLATFRNLPAEAWERRGTASGVELSVRALAFIIAGHAQHHLGILAERYRP